MNVFVLDRDPVMAARYHCDKHVLKMILESAQLLSTTARLWGFDVGYKSTHLHHPCTRWVSGSITNYVWVHRLGLALCDEYEHRYGKVHKTRDVLRSLTLPYESWVEPEFFVVVAKPIVGVQIVPIEKAVNLYRAFYRYKRALGMGMTWREPRARPIWMNARDRFGLGVG